MAETSCFFFFPFLPLTAWKGDCDGAGIGVFGGELKTIFDPFMYLRFISCENIKPTAQKRGFLYKVCDMPQVSPHRPTPNPFFPHAIQNSHNKLQKHLRLVDKLSE